MLGVFAVYRLTRGVSRIRDGARFRPWHGFGTGCATESGRGARYGFGSGLAWIGAELRGRRAVGSAPERTVRSGGEVLVEAEVLFDGGDALKRVIDFLAIADDVVEFIHEVE